MPTVDPRAAGASEKPQLDAARLAGRRFEFSWKSEGGGGGLNGIATLRADGRIEGIGSPNESTWALDGQGRLLFKHADGRVSTRYERAEVQGGALCLEGPFLFRDGIVHSLVEVKGSAAGETGGAPPRNRIGAEAERLKYSKQRFVHLDPGEVFTFRLKDGREKTIRLESVEESKDTVVGLVRRAAVVVAIDGKRLDLECAPYVLPAEAEGLRIQADTTSGRLDMPKRVQLSLWDASDPIVDADLFRFPLLDYRLFSHGTQAYGEPVHLGHRDGDPVGQSFYHDYGFDLAGYEGRQRVVSAIDGTVVQAQREEGTLAIEDDRGIILVYCHLDSILSALREGVKVKRGQWVGMLGRRGGSGNFSHLHVGMYLSRSAMAADQMTRNLNLYPWLLASYLEASGAKLLAVARPHHIVRTGETVVFDGTHSVARGAKIASFRWAFDDGTEASGPRAEKVYEEPGCYSAALWVEDDRGEKDVDFVTVRVFSRSAPESCIPTIFATFTPAADIRPGQPVNFRLWPQGAEAESIRIDFGDGAVLADYVPYSAVTHIFKESGIHVVTISGLSAGLRVTQKLKVIVEE